MSNTTEVTPLNFNFAPTEKQDLMFEYFDNEHTTEVLYGGS